MEITMKTARTGLLSLAVVTLALALAPALSDAAPPYLLRERLDYPNGNLVGQGGWTAHSGAGVGAIQVDAGEAVAIHGSSEDVNTTFAEQSATATTYSCFTMTVTSYTGGGTDYFAHLKDTGTILFRSRVFISPPAGGGAFRVGIAATSSGTSPTVNWSTDLNLNQAYRIVHSYNATTGSSELWVDPVDENSPKITSGPFAAATGVLISGFAIRQGTGATSTIRMDDIVIDDGFVSSGGKPVPSLSTWGIMLLGSLLIAAGGLFVVRRRRVAAA